MKDRLKAAGVNRIIAGLSEEEEYDDEEDQAEAEKIENEEKE